MKKRIDKILVERGLAESREKAQALIMAGSVLVNETPATKAGMPVSEEELGYRLRVDHVGVVAWGRSPEAGATQLEFGIVQAGFTALFCTW